VAFPGATPSLRVLIVNDDVSVSDMFCRTLRLEGFEVWGGFSAKEGLSLADKHRPHAIIIDLRMPLASGIAVVASLRGLSGHAQTPIALVTGDYYVSGEQADVLRSLGATLHYKPLWLGELVSVARELVHATVTL
jgi:DNA-binding response OmpR family regulator